MSGNPPPEKSVLPFRVIDEIQRLQANSNGQKLLAVQKLQFPDGHIELRFGYYRISKKAEKKDRWVWGKDAPIAPAHDFQRLIIEAGRKGWFLPEKSQR